jgi:hypothetical protein
LKAGGLALLANGLQGFLSFSTLNDVINSFESFNQSIFVLLLPIVFGRLETGDEDTGDELGDLRS